MNEGLNTLLEMLKHAEFCRSFVTDPRGALVSRQIDGIPQSFLDFLADLSYEELRLLGNVGEELKVATSGGDGLLF